MMAKTSTSNGKPGKEQKITLRLVSDLMLDPLNPRLALEATASQDTILKRMYIEEALEELAMSLARNGYFWEEPLVVVPAKAQGKFVVVEGNRRLAAVKLLTDTSLRKKIAVTNFPDLSGNRADELKSVPTVTYDSRDDVVPYLGFRHITGVKKWEPLAKARYVAGLINSGIPISQIEESIGDDARTVKKLYQTFIVYKQIEEDLDMDMKEVRNNFSLLEVSLGQQAIKEFLGVARRLPDEKTDAVVPTDHLEPLRELVSWVYGDGRELRVITDSRQIPKRLAPVIANDEAREYLRKTRDVEAAYDRSGGERKYFLKQLNSASLAIERATGIASIFEKDDKEIISQVDRLSTQAEALSRAVRS